MQTSRPLVVGQRSALRVVSRRGYAAKSNDDTLYHLAPKGFWKKFRDNVVVNPEISSGLPLPNEHRYPPPASRPEEYATPATKASDPAQNPYWKRDVRRSYPRLSVITQPELSKLLLASPDVQPATSGGTAVANQPENPDLSAAIATVNASRVAFSETSLPPKPPTVAIWKAKQTEDAPHDPQAYFPMRLFA